MTNEPDLLSLSYYAQAVSYPRPTIAEEQRIIAAARRGDREAREAIITSCLGYVMAVAHTLSLSRNIEYDELIGIGNLILVENLEVALSKDNAYSFLKSCVKWKLLHTCERWCYTYELKGNITAQEQPPEPEPKPECDYTFLYQALSDLTPPQREAVVIYYGLQGTPKQSLYKLSLATLGNPKGSLLYNRLSRGLNKLRTILVQTSGQELGYA